VTKIATITRCVSCDYDLNCVTVCDDPTDQTIMRRLCPECGVWTADGVWNAASIARSSPKVLASCVGRAASMGALAAVSLAFTYMFAAFRLFKYAYLMFIVAMLLFAVGIAAAVVAPGIYVKRIGLQFPFDASRRTLMRLKAIRANIVGLVVLFGSMLGTGAVLVLLA